ncbi:uncharacterized protein LOC144686797 [Cetorhinus maximus]
MVKGSSIRWPILWSVTTSDKLSAPVPVVRDWSIYRRNTLVSQGNRNGSKMAAVLFEAKGGPRLALDYTAHNNRFHTCGVIVEMPSQDKIELNNAEFRGEVERSQGSQKTRHDWRSCETKFTVGERILEKLWGRRNVGTG